MSEIHPIQALLDAYNADACEKRAESQMTLGKLIERLASMDGDDRVAWLRDPHSYRGYYSDLAFEFDFDDAAPEILVSVLLGDCRSLMGKHLEGYKGGMFCMNENTPVWISKYGYSSGTRLMALNDDGTITTAPDSLDGAA